MLRAKPTEFILLFGVSGAQALWGALGLLGPLLDNYSLQGLINSASGVHGLYNHGPYQAVR